jgi:septum formation protein
MSIDKGDKWKSIMHNRIVLASGSPRRRELLNMIGIADFIVIPAECGELMPAGRTPDATVREIAFQKAEYVSRSCDPSDIIIAADTLVYLDGRPIGKPDSPEDAARMLRELSGRRHTVYTGIALIKGGKYITGFEQTDVFFREISEAEILAYVETGEPMDKAGAYGAQGRGAVFIERIEGDFFNVMGLPLCRLSMMLKDFGIL